MTDFPHSKDGLSSDEAPYMDCRNLTEAEIDEILRDATPRPVESNGRIRFALAGGAIGVLVGLASGLAIMGGV